MDGSVLDSRLRSRKGLSLLELVVVLALLAIAGLVAVPSLRPSDDLKLGLAAEEVANALRFARSEALRTGQDRLFRLVLPDSVGVCEPDLASGSIVFVDLLTHPVSKRPYELELSDIPGARGIEIVNPGQLFLYRGLADRKRRVLFDANGLAFFLEAGARHYLTDGEIVLRYGGKERRVRLSGLGRVTVQ